MPLWEQRHATKLSCLGRARRKRARSVASASRGDVAGTIAASLDSVANFRCRRFTSIAKLEA